MLHRRRKAQREGEDHRQKRRSRLREKLPESSIEGYVPLMGATIKFTEEESALDMVQRENSNYAAVKDAQVLLKKEECA